MKTGPAQTGPFPELGQYLENLGEEQSLIGILHRAQGLYGYLGRDIQLYIARKLNIPAAEVFGVVSFYSHFNTEPPGKFTISVCMGTPCYVRGAEAVLEKCREELNIGTGETTADGLFTLKDVRCVGACGLAPVVLVSDKVYGRVVPEDIRRILDDTVKEVK
ncbi:MAG: NAD(P)H-dependent oxidoreductase subunit E [Oscillospiraceae bacterium]|nr:NAD(P)H-dependent oxidoreductase subunit E [Oscillospiraceae bacterium]